MLALLADADPAASQLAPDTQDPERTDGAASVGGAAPHVVWVSNNSIDFGNEDETPAPRPASGSTLEGERAVKTPHSGDHQVGRRELHSDLIEDLTAIAAEGRVTWVLELADAVAYLAAGRVGVDGATTRAILESVEKATVSAFVSEVAEAHLLGSSISPERAALPTATIEATVVHADKVRDLSYTASALASQGAVLEFSAHGEVLIAVRLPAGHPAVGEWPTVDETDIDVTVVITKDLIVSGIVEMDAFSRPLSGEVSSAHAAVDDPGRAAWAAKRAADTLRQTMRSMDVSGLDAIRKATGPSESIAKLLQNIDTSGLDAIRKATEPDEALRKYVGGEATSRYDEADDAGAQEPGEPDWKGAPPG